MKATFNPIKFGLASGITVSICYTICAVMTLISPHNFLSIINSMLLLIKIEPSYLVIPTFPEYIAGVVQVFIYIFIIHWLFATVYNYLLAQGK